jgi:mercuric ion binding protein
MRLSYFRLAAGAVVALAMLTPVAGHAAEKMINLSVENATCALCGPVVQAALQQVPGVTSVEVVEDYNKIPPVTAKVVFDDEKTNVEALINATTNAGYPSRLALNTGS